MLPRKGGVAFNYVFLSLFFFIIISIDWVVMSVTLMVPRALCPGWVCSTTYAYPVDG